MKRLFFASLMVVLFALPSSSSVLRAAEPELKAPPREKAAPYWALMAKAEALRGEQSWTLAEEAFGAAVAAATTLEETRWARLGEIETGAQAANRLPWREQQAAQQRWRAAFAELLKPYSEGLPLDRFGAEARLAQGLQLIDTGEAGGTPLLLEALRFYEAQPAGAKALADTVNVLRRYGDPLSRDRDTASRVEALMEALLKQPVGKEDAAWLALALARKKAGYAVSPIAVDVQLADWARAETLAKGTPLQTVVALESFLASAVRTNGGRPGSATVEDLEKRILEGTALAKAFEQAGGPQETLQRWQQLLERWTLPRISVATPESLRPGEPWRVTWGAVGMQTLSLVVKQLTPTELVQHPAWGRRIESETKDDLIGREVWRKSIDLSGRPLRAWLSESWTLPETLGPGVYRLQWTGTRRDGAPDVVETNTVVVGSWKFAVVTSSAPQLGILVTDTKDEAPAQGRRVVVQWLDGKAVKSAEAETDASGWTSVACAGEPGRTPLAVTVDGEPAFGEGMIWKMGAGPGAQWLGDLVLDRPLYRAGETVHWRLIARQGRPGSWALPQTNREVEVSFETPDGTVYSRKEMAWSSFGTLAGEFTLPHDARPSAVNVAVKPAKTDLPILTHWSAFQVDHFTPPAVTATVQLSSEPRSLQPGGRAEFAVEARYFSGSPVVGATVELAVTLDEPWSSVAQAPELQAWKESISSLRSTTDGLGRAHFDLAIPVSVKSGSTLQLLARCLASGGTAVEAADEFSISPAGLRVEEKDEEGMACIQIGTTHAFRGVVRDGVGRPAGAALIGVVERLRWLEVWQTPDGRIATEDEWKVALRAHQGESRQMVQKGWKTLHAAYSRTEVNRAPLAVGEDGAFVLPFLPREEGLYRLSVWAGDVRLETISKRTGFRPYGDLASLFPQPVMPGENQKDAVDSTFAVLAVGSGTTLQVPPTASLVLSPNRIAHGGPNSGFALLDEVSTRSWIVLVRPEAIASLPYVTEGRLARFELPGVSQGSLPESWTLGIVGEGRRSPGARPVNVEGAWPALHVQWSSIPGAVRPGAAVRAQVRVSDVAGRPVRTELNVAVADQAVEALAGNDARTPKPVPFFTPASTGHISVQARARSSEPLPALLPDPRPYMGGDDDEIIELAAFSVSNTLAGARMGVVESYSPPRSASKRMPSDSDAAEIGQQRVYKDDDSSPPAPGILRVKFSSTAFWASSVMTDEEGRAEVSFTLPDNLTEWRWSATAVGADGVSFGRSLDFLRADLPLQARLRLPEVLVAGDSFEARATLVNQPAVPATVTAELNLKGGIHKSTTAIRRIDVPAAAEANAQWSVAVPQAGPLTGTLRASAGPETDGMEARATVVENGWLQPTYLSLALKGAASGTSGQLPLPQPLDSQRARATVRVDAAGASALLDAVPFLVRYPYGCVEQTLNRFLPAVVVRSFLQRQGVDEAAVESRLLGADRPGEPSFKTLDEVVEAGLSRLEEAQQDDGFGWWPEAPQRDDWMTAYVLWGLKAAEAAGVDVPDALLEKAQAGTLAGLLAQETRSEHKAWGLAALAGSTVEDDARKAVAKVWMGLFEKRATLSPSARAALLLSVDAFGTKEAAWVLLRNLQDGAVRASALGVSQCHWEGLRELCRAEDTPVEATALTLLALLRAAPDDERVDPAAHWLLLNRRSNHWDNTRSTAFAVLALQRWLEVRQPAPLDERVEVFVGGTPVGTLNLDPVSLARGPLSLAIPAGLLLPGGVELEVKRREGKALLFVTAHAEAWVAGDQTKPFANVVGIERVWRRQVPIQTIRGDLRHEPEDVAPGGQVLREERVQARVSLKTPVALEHVKVEVPLPGGASPAQLLSGWDARLLPAQGTEKDVGQAVYREARPGRSVFFLNELPAGEWVLVFDLRADLPGDYQTLPAEVEAMYVPEVRGNTEARRLVIGDKP